MARSNESNIVLEWSKNICKYVFDTLHVTPTEQQRLALIDFQDMVWAKIRCNKNLKPTERDHELSSKFGMSIMSGVGTGKGAFGSWCILWFMTCFPFPKIVVTSPSQKQLSITLWAELAKWHQKSELKEWFTWQAEKFFFKEHGGQQWFAAQRTANTRNSPDEQAETLAGLHEDFLLIIGDESSGIPDPVFRPLESTLTRMCNLCLLLFNPTRSKGFAFETHNKDRANWLQVHWNAEESDNVTKSSIERYAKKYGRDSNFFKIRVLGIPPADTERTIIPWNWIQDSIDREVVPHENDVLLNSLDVGAGGDDSALVKRLGPRVYPVDVASFTESNLLVDWTVRQVLASEPKTLLVDNIGVGWGVSGSLREKLKRHDIDVVDCNVSNSAFNSHRFHRLRDELWWRLRGEFEDGIISLPDDPLLHGDLNTPRYEEIGGKIKVETKKEIKARGIESPNRADALMMTTMYETSVLRDLYVPLHKKVKAVKSTRSWKTV